MNQAWMGLLIFLGLEVTLVAVLLGMAKWEQLAEPRGIQVVEERRVRRSAAARGDEAA